MTKDEARQRTEYGDCEVEFRPLPKNVDGRRMAIYEQMEREGTECQVSLN